MTRNEIPKVIFSLNQPFIVTKLKCTFPKTSCSFVLLILHGCHLLGKLTFQDKCKMLLRIFIETTNQSTKCYFPRNNAYSIWKYKGLATSFADLFSFSFFSQCMLHDDVYMQVAFLFPSKAPRSQCPISCSGMIQGEEKLSKCARL